jgi:hypothetical protein
MRTLVDNEHGGMVVEALRSGRTVIPFSSSTTGDCHFFTLKGVGHLVTPEAVPLQSELGSTRSVILRRKATGRIPTAILDWPGASMGFRMMVLFSLRTERWSRRTAGVFLPHATSRIDVGIIQDLSFSFQGFMLCT